MFLLTYLLTYLLTRSLTHSLTYSLIHSIQCLEATGERYTLLIERHLVGILFFVIVKDTVLTNITDLRGVTTGTHTNIYTYTPTHSLTHAHTGIGIFGIMGNKGGISVRFNLHETSICFVCAHLRAQQKAVDGRVLTHSLPHSLTHLLTYLLTHPLRMRTCG